ncbi:Hypothetical_protein [Hexamita inflata]|uniref:Hypothetical_protein n=1 Tax=Hexamita inflata TaxID=28002 RepID=A0AA86TQM6_9EUKA|nr:Hypothetical protein HINF_LOCUS12721 [Hexamita inflata]
MRQFLFKGFKMRFQLLKNLLQDQNWADQNNFGEQILIHVRQRAVLQYISSYQAVQRILNSSWLLNYDFALQTRLQIVGIHWLGLRLLHNVRRCWAHNRRQNQIGRSSLSRTQNDVFRLLRNHLYFKLNRVENRVIRHLRLHLLLFATAH